MQVTIMYRSTFIGDDGSIYYPLKVEISDYCPACGRKRGKPAPAKLHSDGGVFTVDRWMNICGHIDFYKDVYLESVKIKAERQRRWTIKSWKDCIIYSVGILIVCAGLVFFVYGVKTDCPNTEGYVSCSKSQ